MTDGGKPVIVIVEIAGRAVRPIPAWGGMTMARNKTQAHLADAYNSSRDVSEFGDPEPIEIRRAVTISVRFSAEEIEMLLGRAAGAGFKVTAYIRAAALQADKPIDLVALAADVEAHAHRLRAAVG